MSTFNIIKKNEKYFEATKGSYPCKILIDENSENLELGEHVLAVDDISVRSECGTDLIFRLSVPVEQQSGVCTLRTTLYNKNLAYEAHRLRGRWDDQESAWIFPKSVEKEVNKLMEYVLRTSNPADSGVKPLCTRTALLDRRSTRKTLPTMASGLAGSVKNWETVIKGGAVLRIEIPEGCLSDFEEIEKISTRRL